MKQLLRTPLMMLTSVLALSAAAPQAHAITYEFTAPCSKQPALKGSHELSRQPMMLGAATIEILENMEVPYVGSDRGINSLFDTPVGDESLEVISDSEMKTYGWCYEVNGKIPDELAFQYRLKGSEHVRWFYGYAEFKGGDWVSFCNPAPASTAKQYCSKSRN